MRLAPPRPERPRPPRAVSRYNRQANKERCSKTGKAGFRTKRKAQRIAERMEPKDPTTGLRTYRCPHCDLWHLTGQEQRKAAA